MASVSLIVDSNALSIILGFSRCNLAVHTREVVTAGPINLNLSRAVSQPHAAYIRLELQPDERERRTVKVFIDKDKNSHSGLDGSVKIRAR
jgi:hypothetical protein